MLTIPLQISTERAALLVVLEDDNIERIKQYDPAVVELNKMPERFRVLRFTELHVMYATPAEIEKIGQLGQEGRMEEALKLLTRGWKYRPEQGDHDQPYTPITYSGRAGEA